jgi:hypothetical protein
MVESSHKERQLSQGKCPGRNAHFQSTILGEIRKKKFDLLLSLLLYPCICKKQKLGQKIEIVLKNIS